MSIMIIMLNLGLISFIIILIGGIILVLIVRKIEVVSKCIKNQVRIYNMNVPVCVLSVRENNLSKNATYYHV